MASAKLYFAIGFLFEIPTLLTISGRILAGDDSCRNRTFGITSMAAVVSEMLLIRETEMAVAETSPPGASETCPTLEMNIPRHTYGQTSY